MPNPGTQDGAVGAVPRREQRRCFRRKVFERGEMVHVELGPSESALLLDLSAKGISVQGKKPLMPGLRLSLRFELPESQITLQPTYEVVWAEKSGRIGLKFLYMAEREQRQLEQWLSTQTAEAAESFSITSPVVITPLASQDPLPAPAMAAPVHSPAASPEHNPTAPRQTGGGGSGPTDPEFVAPDLDETLARLVRQAYSMTDAEGAALAIRSGQDVICRASVGNAPDVGMHLNPNSGLSGECFRTGAVVICSDAAHDSRVDPAVARELNLRSVLIVPISNRETTVGLLEVLSSRPSAFDAAHLAALSRIAERAGRLLRDDQAAPAPEIREAEPQITDHPLLTDRPLPIAQPDAPPAEEPLGLFQTTTEAASSGVDHDAIAGIIELLAPELREPAEVAEKLASEPPPPKTPVFMAERKVASEPARVAVDHAPAVVVRPSAALAATRAASAWLTLRNRTTLLIAAGSVVLMVALAVGVWALWFRTRTAKAVTQTPPAAAPQTTVAAPPPAAIVTATPAASATTRPKTTEQKKAAEPSAPEPAPVVMRLAPDAQPSPPQNGSSVPPPLPESGSLRPDLPRIESSVATAVPAAPANPARNGADAALSGPLRVSAEVMRGRTTSQAPPIYPVIARKSEVQGDVVLGIVVAPDGRVRSVRVVSGHPVLAEAASTAVKKWRYQPYVLHGQPIAVETTVTVRFSIPGR